MVSAVIDGTHLFDLCWSKFECHGTKIVTQSLLLSGCRNRNDILINTPSDTNLGRVYRILLCKSIQDVVSRSARAFGDWSERAICGCGNTLTESAMTINTQSFANTHLLLVILQKIDVLKVWVKLDLVESWRHRGCLQNPIEVLVEVVANANRLCKALSLQLLHLLPFLLVVLLLLAEEWCVDEVSKNNHQSIDTNP